MWLTPREGKQQAQLEADIAAVIRACTAPVQVGVSSHECHISAGVAVAPMDGSDAQTLLSHADIAMHRAKKSQDQKNQFFASDFGEQIQRHQTLVKDLRAAIVHRQFELHYQPQFDRLRRCVGYEALLRWRHPVDGLVSPDEFVPVADETGLIIPIGFWVVEQAVATMKRWVEQAYEGRMAVNVSARQLADPSLVETIENILQSHDLAPDYLELEITETALMEDVTTALGILQRFRTLNVLLAVDDFGTGYSSLAYLKALPVQRIKIDRAFVIDLDGTPLLITFCPLCGTGMAFDPQVEGRHLTFGVSGLLYNSDLLMYDHQTESLWSQIEGRAISGPLAGAKLTPVAVRHELWEGWRKRIGRSGKVLSTDTGHRRNYRMSPYGTYDHSERLYFPVTHTSRKYHPKTWVLGYTHNGESKAWPFPELADHGAVLEDTIGGKAVRIEYDPEVPSAELRDTAGELLPATRAFWFAWYTFHPDTQIFEAD